MRQLSMPNRAIGVLGAVETGVGASFFTHEKWANGMFCLAAAAVFASVYLLAERKRRKTKGGRRY